MYIGFQMDLCCNGESKAEQRIPGVVIYVQVEKKDHFTRLLGDTFADRG